ncbi:MAG: M48 family metallopeptidase [Prevotellaceae bacterium]|nr:M48 family metallopeptidase [Prevotellaceae bacterium]MDY6200191.1 M48 family metallopeptidase [Prevotella sp.]
MKKIFGFLLVATILLSSCGTTSTVPITGRKQSILVSDEQVLSLSNQEYTSYMKTAKVSTNTKNTAMVKRVGQKLATAVVNYLNNNGLSAEVANYSWEFNLVQDQSINAFCLPGGKIVVFEGLLPVTKDEASLAIVLGHEIAHAVAKHSAERLSNEVRKQYGSQILSGVLSTSGVSTEWQSLGSVAFGLGSKLGSAAYSRSQENEADHLGLIFAAMAGYNPEVAVPFWQRMAAQTAGTSSLFSDHPSDEKRIKNIQGWMPEAKKYYTGSSTTNGAKTYTPQTTKTLHIK